MSIISKTVNLLDSLSGSATTRMVLNRMVKNYGKVTYVRINKMDQQLDLSIILHGEIEPIEIRVDKYTITQNALATSIRVEQLNSNKLWLHRLLNDTVVGNSIDFPAGEYSDILEELFVAEPLRLGLT
jgi:hypothetical protein